MLTDDGLAYERPHPLNSNPFMGGSGVQRVYRWGNGGLSVVNHPMLHAYKYAWEAAVIEFPGKDSDRFDLTYDTPLSSDVEVFSTDDEANEFIQRAKEHFMKATSSDMG